MRPYDCLGCRWYYINPKDKDKQIFCTYNKNNLQGYKHNMMRKISRINNCTKFKSKTL